MNFFKDKSKLFCFTPGIMLATFVTEFLLALVLFLRHKLDPKTRVCMFTLLGLGMFQLSEYLICRGTSPLFWAYAGFVSITLLPAFGLDFVTLADSDRKRWVPLGYIFSAVMIFSIVYFSLIHNAVCAGNYVIFQMSALSNIFFDVYYLGLVLLAMIIATRDLVQAKKKKDLARLKLYLWVLIGYASFLVPTGVVYMLSTRAQNALPSIMCGFAVTFSFILFFKIVPALIIVLSHHNYQKHNQKS